MFIIKVINDNFLFIPIETLVWVLKMVEEIIYKEFHVTKRNDTLNLYKIEKNVFKQNRKMKIHVNLLFSLL